MFRLERARPFHGCLFNHKTTVQDLKYEILVLYKSDIFFISIERLLLSLTILPMKLQNKVLLKAKKYQSDKHRFMNLLHDLSLPMLAIKV